MTTRYRSIVPIAISALLLLAPAASRLAAQTGPAIGQPGGPALLRSIAWMPTPSAPKGGVVTGAPGVPGALLETLQAEDRQGSSGTAGLQVRHWRQWHAGVPVFGAGVAELIDGNGATRAATVALADLTAAPDAGQAFVLDAEAAVVAALTGATGSSGSPMSPLRKLAAQGPWQRIEPAPSAGFTARQPARVRPW